MAGLTSTAGREIPGHQKKRRGEKLVSIRTNENERMGRNQMTKKTL